MLHKIRELCKERGVTLKQLEKMAGLHYKTIFNWDTSMPSADKLYRVAKALGTTVEYLLED